MKTTLILSVAMLLVLGVTGPAFAVEEKGEKKKAPQATGVTVPVKQPEEKAAAPVAKKAADKAVAPAEAPATAPAAAPVAEAPPAPPPPPAPAPAESPKKKGFWGNLLGGNKGKTAAPAPAAEPAPAAAPTPSAATAEPEPAPAPAPAMERAAPATPPVPAVKVDPEEALRAKVWTSESACKKEALKGQCLPLDCATHTGGACTGYTTKVWLYK